MIPEVNCIIQVLPANRDKGIDRGFKISLKIFLRFRTSRIYYEQSRDPGEPMLSFRPKNWGSQYESQEKNG